MLDNNRLAAQSQLTEEENQQPGAARQMYQVANRAMRHRGVRSVMAALCLVAVSACSNGYVIKATDGTIYNTQGAPVLRAGAYTFTDADGKQQQIYLSKVSQVEKR